MSIAMLHPDGRGKEDDAALISAETADVSMRLVLADRRRQLIPAGSLVCESILDEKGHRGSGLRRRP
jgi:hypothetical protein